MCAFTILTTSLALLINAVSASPVNIEHRENYRFGDECTAGEAFYADCNTCICSEDGTMAACTVMECSPFKTGLRKARSTTEIISEYEKTAPRIHGYAQGQKCPATSFYNDCNLCFCGSDDKSAACTAVLCPPKEPNNELAPLNLHRIDEYSQGQPCPAGELFHDDCNLCHCSANGLSAACTLMVCSNEDTHHQKAPATEIYNWPHIDGYKPGDACPAGEMFFSDCNICQCGADGDEAVCTMISCSSSSKLAQSTPLSAALNYPRIDNYVHGDPCPANRPFLNQCNLCQCSDNGLSAACTLRMCPPED